MAENPVSKRKEGPCAGKATWPDAGCRQQFLKAIADKVAKLETEINQTCPAPHAAPSGGNKLGARKDPAFKAICTAPSINWTPAGATQVPVPYQTVQDLSNSTNTAQTVRFNGQPAYLLDQTTQPKGTGDERGTGKGIRSGTVTGEVKPVSGCGTVRIEGKQVVREGDKCTMNGGNNPGTYVATSSIPDRNGHSTFHQYADLQLASANPNIPSSISLTQAAGLFTCAPPPSKVRTMQKLEPWDPVAEERQRTQTRNSMSIALLGYHGVFGALARFFGQDEESVQNATLIGASTVGLEAAVAGGALKPNVTAPGSAAGTSRGLKIVGPRPKTSAPLAEVYHATSSPSMAQSTLNGIDPTYLRDNSRFGAAFHVALEPQTTLAELAHHNVVATTAIRYKLNTSEMRVLDLTNPKIAQQYNYHGGPISASTKNIGRLAAAGGYNAIKYPSERAPGGTNYAILDNHNKILTPVGVSPIK